MAYLQNATSPSVPYFGLTPAMPAIRKYVEVKSKSGDATREDIVTAALISDSPVVN